MCDSLRGEQTTGSWEWKGQLRDSRDPYGWFSKVVSWASMSEKIVALARLNLPVYLPVTLHYKLKKGNDKYKINGAIIVPQKLASNNKTLQTKICFFSW